MKNSITKHLQECRYRFFKDLEYLKWREKTLKGIAFFSARNPQNSTQLINIQQNIKLKKELLQLIDKH